MQEWPDFCREQFSCFWEWAAVQAQSIQEVAKDAFRSTVLLVMEALTVNLCRLAAASSLVMAKLPAIFMW